MEAKSRCSKCGALLPSDGQCVNCLLQLGLAPDKPDAPGEQPDPSQPLSPALQLAWQIAVGEARKTHHRSVEPEHFFAGICKVLSIVQGGKLRVAPEVSVALRSEAEALAQVLSRFPVHYVSLYRQWRAQLGPGDALHPNGTKISRSAVSRALFGRAVELAGGDPTLTTLHLLKAMLADDQAPLARWLREQEPRGEAREAEAAPEPIAPIRPQGGPAFALHPLHRFGKDLIQLAREGKVQECIGRRQELLQVIRTLARDTRNNPLLVGDAGVGKTAIVEGLAWRIAQNKDRALAGKRVVQLDLVGLLSGARTRDELEERVRGLAAELAQAPDVILFLDELHSFLGPGGGTGDLDVATLFKPILTQPELHCIAATTPEEYRNHIEIDASFERRFQPIPIAEPIVADALEILSRRFQERFEERHGVVIEPAAVQAAVMLSARHLPSRRLPDKAIDLLDEACACVAVPVLSQSPGMEPEEGVVKPATVAAVLAAWARIPVEQLTA